MRAGSVWAIVGTVLLIGLVGTIVGFANKWGQTAIDVVSPENVKKQHEKVIDNYNSMISSASNVCSVQKSTAKTVDPKAPTLVESPTLAYEATFRNIVADYNSSVENLFKAKIVAPAGYPTSVQLNKLDTTDWCTVPAQLKALQH